MKKRHSLSLPICSLLFSGIALGAPPTGLKPVTEQGKDIEYAEIVGGEPAQQGDWPFMTALVTTDAPTSTSLSVAGTAYPTESFTFAPPGDASGELASCGLAGELCTDVAGKVCLIERGDFNFSVKANNCEAGGGIGAIIYNNEAGVINGTMGSDFAGTIPVVAVTQTDGQTLLNQLGEQATLNVTLLPGEQQDSSCGATFLGDRWVLTAAHCVDSSFTHSIQFNVGEHDLSDGAENAIGVRNIFIHPQYDAPTINYDIAIIELTESVDAPVVSLADTDTTNQLASINSPVTVIGWGGRLGYAPNQGPTGDFPDVLHQVELNLLTNNQCRNTYAQSQGVSPQNTGVTDVMICAEFAGGGRSACQGDSGGPLLANTNEGWQQLGIVSWGVGCAADGYPGVYTRVASFNEWVNAITRGVSLVNPSPLPNIPLNNEFVMTVDVMNNATSTQSLTFTSDSADFEVSQEQCRELSAGQTCELTVTFKPTSSGFKQANIEVATASGGVETESIVLNATSLSSQSAFHTAMATDETQLSWYTGGDLGWQENTLEGLESGGIGNNQDSILLAQFEDAGQLSFEWSVSSEENTEEPDEPYDALFLMINGEQIDFISGDVPYTTYEVTLNEGTNLVEWIYSKDLFTTALQDKAFLRNLSFVPEQTSNPDPDPVQPDPVQPDPVQPDPVTPQPVQSDSGSGGTVSWFVLLLLPLMLKRRATKL